MSALLELEDEQFKQKWRALTDQERAALADDIRTRAVDRFRSLTPEITATIKRLEQAQAKTPFTVANVNGAEILGRVHAFIGRFIAYPTPEARVAHTLWIAHTHAMGAWESTPRIAFLSPEPGSGKTRALEITGTLVPRPVEAINTTPAYLFRKVSDKKGLPTILFDEIDALFGLRAKDNEDIRAILNAGHRRGAMAGRCIVSEKSIRTEELPAYCAVALAGLGDLPDTILSRSAIIKMRRRAPTEKIESYRQREHTPEGNALRDQLAAWAASVAPSLAAARPVMPVGVTDRDADVWEPLLAVADVAGGDWPTRARVTAVTLVTLSKAGTPSLGIRLLADLRSVFGSNDAMPTDQITKALAALEEAPWGDLKGKPIDGRHLSNFLRRYGVTSKTVRVGGVVARGYTREDLYDSWVRYLPGPNGDDMKQPSIGLEGPLKGRDTPAIGTVTSVTSVTPKPPCPRCAGEGCAWCNPALRPRPAASPDARPYRIRCFTTAVEPRR